MFIFGCLKRNSLCLPDNFFIDEVLGLLVQVSHSLLQEFQRKVLMEESGTEEGEEASLRIQKLLTRM